MTKKEFIEALGAKLQEELPTSEVLARMQYYEGYIDGEIAHGKTEEEAVDSLGDPLLIARTILDTPRSASELYAEETRDSGDAYYEGAYQAENSGEEDFSYGHHEEDSFSSYGHHEESLSGGHHEESLSRGAREETADGENFGDAAAGSRSEGAHETEQRGDDASADPAGEAPAGEAAGKESGSGTKAETVKGSVDRKRGFLQDENGAFNWGLFGILLAAVMIVVAVIWFVSRVLTALGPAILLLLAVLIIIRTIREAGRR